MKTPQEIIDALPDGRRKQAVEMLDAKQMPGRFWAKLAEGEYGAAASILIEAFPNLDNLADMIWEG